MTTSTAPSSCKMKAVLGIPHEDDKVFINLLSLVFLPELG